MPFGEQTQLAASSHHTTCTFFTYTHRETQQSKYTIPNVALSKTQSGTFTPIVVVGSCCCCHQTHRERERERERERSSVLIRIVVGVLLTIYSRYEVVCSYWTQG